MDSKDMYNVLEWGYDKALNGLPGTETVAELAEDYMKGNGSLESKVNDFIKWQKAKCFTSGFITGLGGLPLMPVTVPANISSVIYVQLRMVAAIAYIGGYDVRDDRVKTMVYACLCGDSAKRILKDAGIEVGKKMAVSFIKKLPTEVILKINRAVGFKLVTKFGEKGIVNLGKAVPVLGGLISGAVDYAAADTVGNAAKKIFIG